MKKVIEKVTIIEGLQVRTSNSIEGIQRIVDLWESYLQKVKAGELDGMKPIYACYSNYASDETGDYLFTLGQEQSEENAEEFEAVEIPAGTYQIYQVEAESPEKLQDALTTAWGEVWADTSLQRTYVADYEYYSTPTTATLCIGIK